MLAPGEGLLVVCCSFGGVGRLRASCSLKFILGNSGGFGVLLDAAQNLTYGKKSGGFGLLLDVAQNLTQEIQVASGSRWLKLGI